MNKILGSQGSGKDRVFKSGQDQRLEVGYSIYSHYLLIVLSALLLANECLAQRQVENRPKPIDPVQGEREARALVADMLLQKPANTNTGWLKIRDTKGQQREIPMRFEIWSTTNTSTSVYEAKDPALRAGETKLTVIHTDGKPNQYLLSEAGQSTKTLSGNETLIPFAGSDFYIADLGLEFLQWPQQRLLKKEMHRSVFCDVLESTNPRPAPDGYSRVVSWVELAPPHGIVHADAYDIKGKIFKRFDPTNVEKVEGEYQLQEMEIRNLKTDSKTRIEFNLGQNGR
jgi:hypothetical protein